MGYKWLGRTGVKVSSLCFGTMSFGGDADEKTSSEMFSRCRDHGINFFDCADAYSNGRSEEILGKLVAGCRNKVVITSKLYNPMGSDINARGASRRYIRQAVEASLRRLQTDYLDIYFLHRFDPHTALEESLRALDDLVHAGKVLYLGVSNFAAWQVMSGLAISDRLGSSRFEVLQPMYNLVKRQAEAEILPMAEAKQLGVISYSPLGGGLLTGKYRGAEGSAEGRLTANSMYGKRYRDDAGFAVAERLGNFARDRNLHPASLAIAWVASHPGITAPIIGARNVEQLQPALESASIDMTTELRGEISALSIDAPVATDRTEENVGE